MILLYVSRDARGGRGMVQYSMKLLLACREGSFSIYSATACSLVDGGMVQYIDSMMIHSFIHSFILYSYAVVVEKDKKHTYRNSFRKAKIQI